MDGIELILSSTNRNPLTIIRHEPKLVWLFLGFLILVVGILILYRNRPIGEDIVFISIDGAISEIRNINVDGSHESRLAYHQLPQVPLTSLHHQLYIRFPNLRQINPASSYYHTPPAWSPDGSQIAFVFHGVDGSILYLIGAHRGDLIPLANGWSPVWSPDGSQIAFAGKSAGGDQDIFTINKDGSQLTRLTHNFSHNAMPNWSPDGSRIAFSAESGGGRDIFTINKDGSNLTRLTYDPAYDSSPAWSLDGSQIAFTSYQDDSYDLFTINATDGHNLTRLTTNLMTEGYLSWSPDDSKIAFVSHLPGEKYTLYVIDADGSNLTQLSDISYSYGWKPAWSPSGSQIAFSSSRDGHSNIYIINADGTNLKQLTFNEANDYSPGWRP